MIEEWKKEHTVTVHEIPGTFPMVDSTARSGVKRILAGLEDIVVVDGLALPLLEPYLPLSRIVVVIYHNPLHLGAHYPDNEKEYLLKMDMTLLPWVEGIICTSSYSRYHLHKLDITVPMIEVNPGVDHRVVESRTPSNTVLIVGAITPRKNQVWLVSQLFRVSIPLSIVIVGPHPDAAYHEELLNLTSDPGIHTVHIAGKVESLEPYYQSADVLVHTPTHESYGMVLTEAMSYGLPVIATNVDGIPATLGLSGILIESGGDDQLISAVELILSSAEVYEELSLRSTRQLLKKANWSEQANQILNFLQKLSA
jgi:glycosyltransferase involved in cell wall biosynthesis